MAHGDYTGQNKARLAQEFAEQQQLAAQSKTLVTQVVAENRSGVVDLFTEHDRWAAEHAVSGASEDGDIQVVDVKDENMQPVKFRASETLDQITIGKDREFNLKEGQVYRAPKWVVEHLDQQGLVWH